MASRTTSAELSWHTDDHHGTAQLSISAADLTNVQRRKQTPFGQDRGTPPGDWPTERGFVGGTNDPTDLVHLGAREYDPAIGRFISVDPIMDLTDPQQIHGYVYANSSPVSRADPSGLLSISGSVKKIMKQGGASNKKISKIAKKVVDKLPKPKPKPKPKSTKPIPEGDEGSYTVKPGASPKEVPGQEPKAQKKDDGFVPKWIKDLAANMAWAFDAVATLVGMVPGFICAPCAAIGITAGTLAGVAYIIAGKIGDAIKAFGGALLGAVLGPAGKLLSNKIIMKKFAGEMWEVANHVRSSIPRWKLVPSLVRVKAEAAVDTITAGIGTLYNGIAPPAPTAAPPLAG